MTELDSINNKGGINLSRTKKGIVFVITLILLIIIVSITSKNINTEYQLTDQDRNEIISIVKVYNKVLDRILNGKPGLTNEVLEIINKYKNEGDYTKGHFYRGII